MIGIIDEPADWDATAIIAKLRVPYEQIAGGDSRAFLLGFKLGFLAGYLAGEQDHTDGRHDPKTAYERLRA